MLSAIVNTSSPFILWLDFACDEYPIALWVWWNQYIYFWSKLTMDIK